jgi:hypothetical protein
MSVNIVFVQQPLPINNMGITPGTPAKAATGSTVTTKLALGTNQVLIPANPNRGAAGVNVTNLSATASLWLDDNGDNAVVGLPSIELPPGANYDFPITGAINGIWAAGFTATDRARMIEYV